MSLQRHQIERVVDPGARGGRAVRRRHQPDLRPGVDHRHRRAGRPGAGDLRRRRGVRGRHDRAGRHGQGHAADRRRRPLHRRSGAGPGRGPGAGVLQAERVALNLVQRMCGIATLTARYVEAVAGTTARVVDTRKTTPGLRALERHAVRCGGGHNHRYSLSDAVMAKDNHLAVVDDISAAIRRARAELPHTMHIEVEVDRLDQIDAGAGRRSGHDHARQLLPRRPVEGVRRIGGRAIVEACGGITLDTIAASRPPGSTSSASVPSPTASGRSTWVWTWSSTARDDQSTWTRPPPPRYAVRCWRRCGRISTTTFGNPSSHHEVGEAAARASRRPPAGPSPTCLVPGRRRSPSPPAARRAPTRRSRASRWPEPRGRHVIISAVEHPAVLESARWLGRLGFDVTELGRRRRRPGLRPTDLAAALRPRHDAGQHPVRQQRGRHRPADRRALRAHRARTTSRSTPTRCRRPAGWTSTSADSASRRSASPATSSARPRASASSTCARRTRDRAPDPRRRSAARPALRHRERGRRRGDRHRPAAGPDRRPPSVRARRDAFIARVEQALPGARLTGHRHRPAAWSRLVRAPRPQRRVGAARPGAARRDLLQRIRLRRRQRRALPCPDRDGLPSETAADRAALHLRGRRHRRRPATGGGRAHRGGDRPTPGSLARVEQPVEPYASGLLRVADGSQLWWEASGKPGGIPALFLHGGPGGRLGHRVSTSVRR